MRTNAPFPPKIEKNTKIKREELRYTGERTPSQTPLPCVLRQSTDPWQVVLSISKRGG